MFLLGEFLEDLRNVFSLYYKKNYIRRKLFLNWDELRVHNKKMKMSLFAVFLSESLAMPALINIDQLVDCCSKTVINQDEKLTQFYQEKRLKCVLKSQKSEKDFEGLKIEGDPGLNFPEFILLICRVVAEISKSWEDSSKQELPIALERFFREYLFIRRNTEIAKGVFPFHSKSRFSQYLSRVETSNLSPISNEFFPRQLTKNIKEVKKDSNYIEENPSEINPVSVEEGLGLISKYFSEQRVGEFQLEKSDILTDINTKQKKSELEMIKSTNVVTLGTGLPVSKTGKSETRKPTLKNVISINKKIQTQEEISSKLTFQDHILANYHLKMVDGSCYKSQINKQVDTSRFGPELIYPTLRPPVFRETEKVSLLVCFTESCKKEEWVLANSVWTVLFTEMGGEINSDVLVLSFLFLVRGLMFERMNEHSFALTCFTKNLRLYPRLINKYSNKFS